jgi:acetylornithine deacetylase/succinyl-diaminopimelate desuccinylase-like protein
MLLRTAVSLLALVLSAHVLGQANASPVAQWRAAHERQIVDELMQLVSLPNVAGNDAEMQRNADLLEQLFARRGFRVEQSKGPGAPVVLATLDVPAARGTLTLYIHYDGQLVTASEWTRCQPFVPCIYGPSGEIPLDDARKTFDPQWRMYGRSTSDDKGPIVAVLSAMDALRATGKAPTWNLRVVLDGEEEAGSASFLRFAAERGAALKADLAITLDGPRHASGKPTLYFGVRGMAGMTLTVYGARSDLHSGNYGNWAPDPSMRLARLLASMKDDAGRVTIEGFYADVTPLSATELRALEEIPNVEAALMKDFGVARPERPEQRLERKLNEPTLSILTMETACTHCRARPSPRWPPRVSKCDW